MSVSKRNSGTHSLTLGAALAAADFSYSLILSDHTLWKVTGRVSALQFGNDLGPQQNNYGDRLDTEQSHH